MIFEKKKSYLFLQINSSYIYMCVCVCVIHFLSIQILIHQNSRCYNWLRNKQKWMERGMFTSDILGMLCLLVLSSDVSVSCVCVGRVCGVWVRISGRVWMDCWWCQWEAECNNTGMTDLLKGMREDPRASQPYLYSSHWCPRSQWLPIMLHRCQTVTVVWK